MCGLGVINNYSILMKDMKRGDKNVATRKTVTNVFVTNVDDFVWKIVVEKGLSTRLCSILVPSILDDWI